MSISIEFGSKATADQAREEHAELVCPVDDDARKRTVHFVTDAPDTVLDRLRAQADEGTAERADDGPGQAPLTDAEKDRLDFSKGRANVPWARSIKALAQRHGVSDWTAYVDPTLTVDEHRQVMEEAALEGGGARDDGDQSDAEREASAAATEQAEGCNHARGHCENGDPDACEFLQEACGYDEPEVKQLLAVTDGGREDGDGEIGGQPGGALRRSWGGYKGAVSELARSLEDARKAWEQAQQAARAINGIRDRFEQDPLHFEALEAANADLLDITRKAAADCHECHADHGEHDHKVTSGDREDLRKFVGEGASETPVGTNDETDAATGEANLGPLAADDRHTDDSDDGLAAFGVEADEGSDGPSREFRRAQNDGYLRVSDAEGVENVREGLGQFGARSADTRGLDELAEEADS